MFNTLIPIIVGLLFCAAMYFFVYKKYFPTKAKTIKTIPVNTNLRPEYFEQPPTPTCVIWKLKDRDTQPSGDVECVAYSTQEQMESPPFNVVTVPTIRQIFDEIADLDKIDNSIGLSVDGGISYLQRHGYITEYYTLADLEQMKQFVKGYGTFQTMVTMKSVPRFRDGFWVGNSGVDSTNHSMVVFGVDETIICPAVEQQGEFPAIPASVGAFRVRWHVDFFGGGDIEGWISFQCAKDFFVPEYSYGYTLKGV